MSNDLPPFLYTPLQPGEIRLLYASTACGIWQWNGKGCRGPLNRQQCDPYGAPTAPLPCTTCCIADRTTTGRTKEPISKNITWTLRIVQLHNLPEDDSFEFDALSYTWGDQTRTFPFVCNRQHLQVHRNLHEALPYLAHRRSSLPIWIDAICINQRDAVEKMVQIRQMHRIYRRAHTVWIWLGPPIESTVEAIQLLPDLTAAAKRLGSAKLPRPERTLEKFGLPSLNSTTWRGLYQIINNPWFDRLWVVQEAALARRPQFLTGLNEIEWTVIKTFDMEKGYLHQLGVKVPLGNRKIFGMRDDVEKDGNLSRFPGFAAFRLVSLLVSILAEPGYQCQDPRDRVFGLLGFVEEDIPTRAGLNSARSVVDIYTNFIKFLLLEYPKLEEIRRLWSLVGRATTLQKMSGLPSWVPDLTQRDEVNAYHEALLDYFLPIGDRRYVASGENLQLSGGRDARELIMKGKILDSINMVYPELPVLRVGSQESCRPFRNWELSVSAMVLKVSPPNSLDQNSSEQFDAETYFQTLMAGDCEDKTGAKISYQTLLRWRESINHVVELAEEIEVQYDMPAFQKDEWDKRWRRAVDDIKIRDDINCVDTRIHRLERRPIFSTHAGRLGFAISGIREGDLVVVFNSAPTPHIIRRVADTDEELYELVGEAYVHGMMHGEIDSLGIEAKDITLV